MANPDTGKLEGQFSVVLVDVPQEGKEETVSAFAEAFHLEPGAAQQVVATTPVILFRNLAKPEVRAIKKKLIDLSKRGVEFRITPRPSDSLPTVAWPTKPGFAETAGGELVPKVDFQWSQHAFACPTCGEAFVIRPIGKAVISQRPEARPVSAPAMKPVAAPVKEEKKAAPPPTKPPASKPTPAKKKVEVVEEIEEIAEISEPVEEVSEIEEVQEISDTAEEVEEIKDADEGEQVEEIEEIEEIADVSGDIEMIDLDETPKKGAPAKKPAAKAPEKKAAPPAKPSKPAKKEEEEEEEEGGGDGEEVLYSVFLSRITRPDQQAQAAKVIAEVRSCPMSEAKDLAGRMVIPVIKDVSKEDAEECLEKFKKLKIQGRITKKK